MRPLAPPPPCPLLRVAQADEKHVMSVWNWYTGEQLCIMVSLKGEPPQLFCMACAAVSEQHGRRAVIAMGDARVRAGNASGIPT